MSPNIAIPTSRTADALELYTNVLGFSHRPGPGPAEVDAAPITFFVTDDPGMTGPVLELFVDDLEAARDLLLAHGCEVVRWRGKGQDCYMRDPFGVTFNLWEEADPP